MTPPPLPSFSRWPWWRRWFGRRSETAAAKFLRRLGYQIVARNVEDRAGEIDLLAVDGRTLVVVEVRSSESADFEQLARSVDMAKQRRITRAALRYLQHRRLLHVSVRFDVLAIYWPVSQRRPEIRHYRNAFQAIGTYQLHY